MKNLNQRNRVNENINKQKSNASNKKIVLITAAMFAISGALNANTNNTDINTQGGELFLNSKPQLTQNDIPNNKITSNKDSKWEDLIDRDPKALEKANKKVEKADKKLDLGNLGLTTHEIDSLLNSNIKQLENLKVLILSGSDLSKGLPQAIFQLKNLEELEIQESRLPESIDLSKLNSTLKYLFLSFNGNLKYVEGIQDILENLEKLDRDGTKINKSSFTQSNDKEINKNILKEINKKIKNKELKYR